LSPKQNILSCLVKCIKNKKKLTALLSVVVVLCVSYTLILPAMSAKVQAYCNLEEHTHTSDCYLSDTPLCEKEEDENHTHTKECYTSNDPLCGLEEHTHARQCQSNEKAVDSIKEIEESLPKTLDEDLATALLQVAKSQMDYQESSENFEVQEDGSEKGYTRYGEWAKNLYGSWNGYFAGWCLEKAGFDLDDLKYSNTLSTWYSSSKQLQENDTEDMQEGDILFYINTENTLCVGILSKTGEEIKAIAGDVDDKVQEINLEKDDILGFISLNEKESPLQSEDSSKEETPKQEEKESKEETNLDQEDSNTSQEETNNTAEDAHMKVSISYGDSANLPAGTKLVLTEKNSEKDSFDADLSLVYQGKEIEPSDFVEVTVEFLDDSFENEKSLALKHILNSDVYEQITANRTENSEHPTFTFSMLSFSEVTTDSVKPDEEALEKVSVTFNYIYENNKMAARSQTLVFGAGGNNIHYSHKLPVIEHYSVHLQGEEENLTSFVVPEGIEDGTVYTFIYYPTAIDYTISYYQQCLSQDCDHGDVQTQILYGVNYHLEHTDEKTGLIGEKAEIDDQDYTGFFLYDIINNVALDVDQDTNVEVYYKRNSHTINVHNDGASAQEKLTRLYGETLSQNDVSLQGYEFKGWFYDAQHKNQITTDLVAGVDIQDGETIYALLSPAKTSYTVQVWLKDASNQYQYFTTYSDFYGTTESAIQYTDIQEDVWNRIKKTLAAKGYDSTYYEEDLDMAPTGIASLAGDNSSTISVYVKPKVYTLRFYYARKLTSGMYQVSTYNGNYSKISSTYSDFELISGIPNVIDSQVTWENAGTSVDFLKDTDFPEGLKTGTTTDSSGNIYYYLDMTADFNADLSELWPVGGMFNKAGNFTFFTWGTRQGTAYNKSDQGQQNPNIVGLYSRLDTYMADKPDVTADTGNPTQTLIAYWRNISGSTVFYTTYNIYYSALQSDDLENSETKIIDGVTYVKQADSINSYAASPLRASDPQNGCDFKDRFVAPSFIGVQYKKDSADLSEVYSDAAYTKQYTTNYRVNAYGPQVYYQTADIYYDREILTVALYNYNGETISVDIPYGEDLSVFTVTSYKDSSGTVHEIEPCKLSELAPLDTNDIHDLTYYWTGNWSQADPTAVDYTEYNPNNPFSFNEKITSSLCLVAEYQKRTVKVNFYKDESGTSDSLLDQTSVDIFTTIPETYDPLKEYSTISKNIEYWYIITTDAKGQIHRDQIDIYSHPFTEDTNIYAEINNNVTVNYRIEYYQVDNDKEVLKYSESGTALEFDAKTFGAKGASTIGIDKGYYPDKPFASITFDPNDETLKYEKDTNTYVIQFFYSELPDQNYTVKYIFYKYDENKQLVFDKTESTNVKYADEVATENYKSFEGYVLKDDLYQKTLVLSSDPSQNIFTFEYIPATDRTKISLYFYTQQLDGTYALYNSITYDEQIGTTVLPEAVEIEGYKYNSSLNQVCLSAQCTNLNDARGYDENGVVAGKDGLSFHFYYDAMQISIKKHWLNSDPEDVTFTLYKVDGSTYTPMYSLEMKKDSKNLSVDGNTWLENYYVPYLKNDQSYALVEDLGGYIVTYSQTESLTYIENKQALLLACNENISSYEVELSNAKANALPSTGGNGTSLYYEIGILCLAAGGALTLYKKRNS
jgi:LPXTG-motif cell wall-anchored protein